MGSETTLASFLRSERASILQDWESAIRRLPVTEGLDRSALLNHLPHLLDRIAAMVGDVETGRTPRPPGEDADEHALQRLEEGYGLEEVVEEYAVLRECILRRWARRPQSAKGGPVLNRALDHAIAAAVGRYSEARQRSLVALDRVSKAALQNPDLESLLKSLSQVLLETDDAVDTVLILLRQGDRLVPRAAVGVEALDTRSSVPVGEGFAGTVAATGRPLMVRDASSEQLVLSQPIHDRRVRALYGVPLIHEGEVVGVAKIGSTTATDFSLDAKVIFRAMVERVTTLIAHHQLRGLLERSEGQRLFLAEASALLSRSLDLRVTLEELTRLVVPRIADWCAIDLLTDEGRIDRVAVFHADPAKLELAASLQREFPPDPDRPHGTARTIRSGETEYVAAVDKQVMDGWGIDPRHSEILSRLGIRSFISVPLAAHGRTFGALLLVTERERSYDRSDVEVIEELGRRAAFAVENARLYRDAQEAIRARDELWAVASHELRNPLASLSLQLHSLRRRAGDCLSHNPDLAVRIDGAERQVDRLVDLTSNLLDTTRVQAGLLELHPEPFDLTALTEDLVERFRPEAEEAGSTLEVEAGPPLHGCWDRVRIEQVLTNLISNAIKYGDGKPIRVETGAAEGKALLRVVDRGIGMSPETLRRVFAPFERAAEARSRTGLGLGLYIARRIVEAHGGAIHAASVPGRGSTFTVELPLDAGCASHAAAP